MNKSKPPKTKKIISQSFYQQGQSWQMVGIYEQQNGLRLRVHIKRNAYDEQSFAKLEVFSQTEKKWNLVHSKPIQQCACRETSYVLSPEEFERRGHDDMMLVDRDLLVKVANEILNETGTYTHKHKQEMRP